ncbi:hypothetical protein DERF_011754 [Dermatophagoides farinae]|uniref:Cadherin domain-containing protein n=1 Tax=Dermatophagoides farinae TaxID=6954 RepID=A0A922HW11_DERFA|nr:hypothetical protein DERF_011754 [Dermatophagoides farinae]
MIADAHKAGFVIGDATDNGDIELSIIDDNVNNDDDVVVNNNSTDQSSIPIRIEPGTKKLILVRKLDKESVEGESSVTIAIRCRPKRLLLDKRKLARKLSSNDQHESNWNRVEKRIATDESIDQSYLAYDTITDTTSDDDIIIPIRILVTDANDNKPEWQGNVPYSVNISEMSSPGSVVLTGIRAIDNDQLGPYSTVEYYVEPGPYSHLLRFASPLEGTLLLAAQLDYETLPKFWVSIRAQDQGNPPNTAVTKVNVQVIDADDQNPRFEVDKYTAILGEGQITAHPLQVKPKPIRAEDPDRAIQSQIVYEFNSKDEDSRENAYFKINAQTGQVSLKRPLHSSVALPITLVIRATQLDNRDRYALTTLTIVSKRDQVMPELRFLHSNYSTSLLESTPPGQVVLTVQSSRPASTSNQPLRFQILDDEHGYFSIKNSGEIVVNRMLDYEKHHRYSFRVMVTDGLQTDLARVTIDIINVNEHDPVFGQSTYVFHVNEARLRSSPVIGQMQATDADDGDLTTMSIQKILIVMRKKLLENLSPVKRSLTTTTTTMPNSNSSIEQPDSAISSDISCQWSDSHKISTHSSQANNSRSQSEFNSDSTHSDININPISTCSPTPDSNASRISVIRWPQGSIPRRVKKLTWKDEQRNNHLDQLYTSNSIVQAQRYYVNPGSHEN